MCAPFSLLVDCCSVRLTTPGTRSPPAPSARRRLLGDKVVNALARARSGEQLAV